MFDFFANNKGSRNNADKVSPVFYYLVVQTKMLEKHATKRR